MFPSITSIPVAARTLELACSGLKSQIRDYQGTMERTAALLVKHTPPVVTEPRTLPLDHILIDYLDVPKFDISIKEVKPSGSSGIPLLMRNFNHKYRVFALQKAQEMFQTTAALQGRERHGWAGIRSRPPDCF